MTYSDLLKMVSNNDSLSKKIYICCFINCAEEKMKYANITIIKNVLGFYVVTYWLDYEYQKYLERKVFKNKDDAANYAWEIALQNKIL